MIGFVLPRLRHTGHANAPGATDRCDAQRLGARGQRQQRHHPVRALRNGPGRVHVDADAGRRRARSRPHQGQGRIRARRRALHQHDARRPVHRRLDLGARRLRQAARRRRAGAHRARARPRRRSGTSTRRGCTADNAVVTGPGGKKATYGELAEAASKLTPPKDADSSRPRRISATSASGSSASTRRPRSTARPSSAST